MAEFDKLLVIVGDSLSELARKGEITHNYYNPGSLFKEVHILLTNNDGVEVSRIQKLAGNADIYLYNNPLPGNLFLRTLGWQKFFLEKWIQSGVKIVRKINPDLIRTHSSFMEGYLAKRLKDEIGIPYIISIHSLWGVDVPSTATERITKLFARKIESAALQNADGVIAVYKTILDYLKRFQLSNTQLIYNIIAKETILEKTDYTLSKPPRLITINRQIPGKNPENIIKAISDIDCSYVIVGDGPYHERLKKIARDYGCEKKVQFIKSIPNEDLCAMLKDFDIYVSHIDYKGISKGSIEASLAGLPVIINKNPSGRVSDIEGDWLILCNNTPKGYKDAILGLIHNSALRKEYGERALAHAHEYFDSRSLERKTVELYTSVIKQRGATPGIKKAGISKGILNTATTSGLKIAGRLQPSIPLSMYSNASKKCGLKRSYFILSLDCDTEFDITVAEQLHARLGKMGISPVYAVPGTLLEEGREVYRKIAASGAQFLNHGYAKHTSYDPKTKTYKSTLFYDALPNEDILNDIRHGHASQLSVLGKAPSGFRTPHFGSFQNNSQLDFLHSALSGLGYTHSTSTVPSYGFLHGAIKKTQSGIYEIPVSGCYDRPYSILDAWGFRFDPQRRVTEDDYVAQFKKMAAFFHKSVNVGLLNYYVDPSQVYNWEPFFDCLQLVQDIALSSYTALLKETSV